MHPTTPLPGFVQPQRRRCESVVAADVRIGGRDDFLGKSERSILLWHHRQSRTPMRTSAATTAFRRTRSRAGFTLLEMIMVLVIIAILACLSLPSFSSAISENAIRKDSHQLALMVKTAMIQSADQHRAYMIELSPTEIALHPVGEAAADPDAAPADVTGDDTTTSSAPVDVVVTSELDPANKLQIPDPQKDKAWIEIPPTQWIFQPGELCPATQVRFLRGKAWIAMNFGALTGNVENETFELP